MKATFFLILCNLFTLHATTVFSQNKVTMKGENIPLKSVLVQIEKEAQVKFVYRDETISNFKVDFDFQNSTIEETLNVLLKGTGNTYRSLGNNLIVITPAELMQGITITGTVTDTEGNPLPGVSIVIKGTMQGTVTDNNGTYSLQVRDEDAILSFSFVGFATQEVSVGSQRTINMTMSEDTKQLEEVVVIGYGSRTKRDLTGAVSQISSEEITRQVALSPEFAMQGKMAGVFVSNTGSDPVARPTIRIRGVTTLGFNDPLYVVDGVPLTEGGASAEHGGLQDFRGNVNVFTMINPNDIESISVLKDASATAIYGVRASNGVILITTKRGSEGKPMVNLTASYGVQNIFKRYDVVSQQEFVDMTLESINNNTAHNKEYWYPLFDKSSPEYMGNKPNYSKDWMNALLNKNAPVQDYNISVSGGTKRSNYAVGAGFTSQEDAVGKNSFDRYSFFLNSDHKLTNWLKVGESYRFIYSTFDQVSSADFRSISFMTPWQPLYDTSMPDGLARPGRDYVAFGETAPTFHTYGYGIATRNNFLGRRNYEFRDRQMMRNLGTFYAEVSPLQGLRMRATFSFDYYTNTSEDYSQAERGFFSVNSGRLDEKGNTYTRRLNENINTVKEFLVGYANRFGDHSIDVIGNVMAQQIQWNLTSASNDQYSPIEKWDQRYIAEGWPRDDKGLLYDRHYSGLLGYMGRLSYNYAQRYYLDATVRRDGTSKFGPGYKWGTFPSFAAAWRISSEGFMQNFSWMNDLKIRGGWGQTGNQETLDFAYLALINQNPKAAFGDDSSTDGKGSSIIYPAAAYANYPIKDMTWETVTTFSLGFDLIALQNRLSFTAEYYTRNTEGILQTVVIPWTLGAPGSPRINLAAVSNKGFEFQAGYNDRFGDIGVNASANLTTVKNRVDDLYRGQRQGSGNTRIQNGYSMNYLYGYQSAGIFQTQQEVEDWRWKGKPDPNDPSKEVWVSGNDDVGNMSQKAPGDVKFVDIKRAPNSSDPKEQGLLEVNEQDGRINDYDRTYLGKTIAGYYYGITLGADYKNWDIVLGFRGVGDVQGESSYGLNSISGGGEIFATEYRNRWTPTNPSNKIPRAIQNDPSRNNRFSDRHVHNAGFFRFQNFQIGYNFKGDLINRVGISNLRCYFSGSNIFVIAPSWPDLDPENITTPTVFTFGINVSF